MSQVGQGPPLRVLHIIDSLGTGGAEALLVTAARGLPSRAVSMSVIALAGDDDRPFAAALRELGVSVEVVRGSGPKPLFDPRRFRALVARIRELAPDVVQTHLVHSNIVGGLAARAARRPHVATIHNVRSDESSRYRRLDRLEQSVLAHGRSHIVAVGREVGAAAARRWPDRHVEVVPNPAPSVVVDAGMVPDARAELLGTCRGPLLLSVGRLNSQKGFDILLDSFAELSARRPDAVLAIAGRGGLDGELRAQARRLGVDRRVRFLGVRADVPTLMAAADCYVSASRWEGLPLTVLEAMSVGTPVVATAVGDVGEVLRGGAGLLVEPEDAPALAAAVEEVVSDPDVARSMANTARARAATEFGEAAWLDRLRELYDRVGRAPIRLAIVLHGYYPRIGGIERMRAAVTPRLAAQGIAPTVVCRQDPGTVPFEVLDGVPVRRIPVPGPRPLASLVFTVLGTAAVVRRRPDVVQADQFLSTSRVGLLAARLLRAPLVVVTHRSGPIGDVQLYGSRRSGARRVRAIAERARILVGVSEECCEELEGLHPGGEVRLIRNGIDTHRYAPADAATRATIRDAYGIPHDNVVYVFVGRLAPEKRAGDLLDAWRRLGDDRVRSTLLFIGEGPKPPEVRPDDGDVRLLGVVDNVAPLLSAVDVFVLPSTAEGLSVAAGEAAASGLAMILTDVGAARDIVEPGVSGLIVPPLDPDELAAAVRTLFDDAELRHRYGAAARDGIVRTLGIDQTVAEYVAVVRDALGDRRG